MTALFSFLALPNRIGRVRFILHTAVYFIIYAVVSSVVLWALVHLANSRPDWTLGHWPMVLLFILYLLGIIPHQLPARRRLADCALSPHWALLLFFPLLNAPVLAILLCKPGSPGQNRFGDAPPPNTCLLYFNSSVLLIATAIGIYYLVQVLQIIFNA